MNSEKLSDRLYINFETKRLESQVRSGQEILKAVRALEAENERFKGESKAWEEFAKTKEREIYPLEKERDALRAELDKIQNTCAQMDPLCLSEREKLRAELEQLRLALRVEKTALVESENIRVALRAEVETLRRELATYNNVTGARIPADDFQHAIKLNREARNTAIRERDEARAELARVRERFFETVKQAKKDAAEVATLRRENESLKCDVNYSESLIRDRNTAIRERDEAQAELLTIANGTGYAYQADGHPDVPAPSGVIVKAFKRLSDECDKTRAERDDALDKLRICGECATITLRNLLERERHSATAQEWCTLQGERDTAIRERDEARKSVAHGNSLLDKAYDERDAALAKLERVRTWANTDNYFIFVAEEVACRRQVLAILDDEKVRALENKKPDDPRSTKP